MRSVIGREAATPTIVRRLERSGLAVESGGTSATIVSGGGVGARSGAGGRVSDGSFVVESAIVAVRSVTSS